MRAVGRFLRRFAIVLLFVLAAASGTVAGVLVVYASDLPQISALDDYSPSTITRVYASGGEVVGEFATQRRIIITYDQIPKVLRQAIMAAEDADFESHMGFSVTRIIVTLVRDLFHGKKAGASTLTQQLTRKLFLNDEKTWERKVKEAVLAIQIEKRYTKPEIVTLYCNQIPWGHGTYGVEAAARLYFGKSAKDVNLEEAALLAGIIQAPARHSPYVNMRNAMARRNYALGQMADEGFITRVQAEEAKKKPIVTAGRPVAEYDSAFFVEEVRQQLEDRYGAQQLYENGLSVYTTLDLKLQHAAEQALADGMRRIDHRRGFRKPERVEAAAIAGYKDPSWTNEIPEVGKSIAAIVTGVEGQKVHLRAGAYEADLAKEDYAWTGKPTGAFLSAGDVVHLLVKTADATTHRLTGTLDQEPLFEGAVLAIQNRTGRVLAMVGGKRFELSRFNRATQAMRQLGSSFKPIVYATAIDRGFTPVSILQDSPVSYNAGPGQPLYAPLNYDKKFEGPITLRHGLEESRNVPTVRLMEALGPTSVASYAERLGFKSKVQPYLSSALGSSEATLQEVVCAFAAFPNQGVRVEPFEIARVTDRQGNVLEENRPKSKEALRADTAFVMTSLLQGVIQRGTAAKAASLKWPLGGKTGTTDDFTDAWFTGFDPDITIGVWVGYDRKKPLGPGESGANAALPIWIDIMKTWIGDRKNPPEFAVPANVVFLPVDRFTGAPVDASTPGAIKEAFIAGTQPGAGFGTP